MVRDPRERRRPHGAHRPLRPGRRDEPGHLPARHRRSHHRRLGPARFQLAPAPRPRPRGRELPGRSAGKDDGRQLQGRTRAHPDEEHLLRGGAGGAAGHRHGDHEGAAQGDLRRQGQAARRQLPRHRSGLRLRARALRLPPAGAAGADGRQPGLDRDRRQHGGGARVRLRGRDGGRLVSDHAIHLAGRRLHRLLPPVPQGPRDREKPLRHRAG